MNNHLEPPDHILWLNLHPRLALQRGRLQNRKKDRFEQSEVLFKAHETYKRLSNIMKFHVIDAEPDIEQVHNQIKQTLLSITEQKTRTHYIRQGLKHFSEIPSY